MLISTSASMLLICGVWSSTEGKALERLGATKAAEKVQQAAKRRENRARDAMSSAILAEGRFACNLAAENQSSLARSFAFIAQL